MSFRRFVYLVTDDAKRRSFLLRRIDMSRFFLPKRESLLADEPPPLEQGRLPPIAMKFDPPTGNVGIGYMDFMLFAAGGDSGRNPNHKMVATDCTGRALLYDPESPGISSLPSLMAPKFAPVSMTVGDSLYVFETNFALNHRHHCFDVYFYNDGWCCHSLPPPPYAHGYQGMGHVDSYAVIGGNILVSKPDLGTHSFDTASCVWAKAGDWVLPFIGHVHHVPEHNLWFGLSCGDSDDEDDHDGAICASDLTVTPPTALDIWKDLTSPRWTNKSSYLVHLGHSRFCHARFFEIRRPHDVNSTSYVVFSGIEVEKKASGEFCVVKHRSEQCRLVNKSVHWIL